jgi:hypothetical protein
LDFFGERTRTGGIVFLPILKIDPPILQMKFACSVAKTGAASYFGSSSVKLVGAAGIEPATPTMST